MPIPRLRLAALLFSVLTLSSTLLGQTVAPHEHFEHATVLYDFVMNSRGQNLRTFITRPNNATGKIPVIFLVGWLSCDTMESPNPAG